MTLLNHPAAGGLISRETVQAASFALWKIGLFNQLVREKSAFNAHHLPQIKGTLSKRWRTALADAAFWQSKLLHAGAVGDVSWYSNLMERLEANIEALLESRC